MKRPRSVERQSTNRKLSWWLETIIHAQLSTKQQC